MIISEQEKNRIVKLHESYRNRNGSLIKEEWDEREELSGRGRGFRKMRDEMRKRPQWDKSKWADEGEYIRSQKAPESRFPDDIIGNEYLELQNDGTHKLTDEFVVDNPELQVLHISAGDQPEIKLDTLPENLGNLKYLHSLSLPNNPYLTKLPMSILDMEYLSTLNLINTPVDMPQDFWDRLDAVDVVVIGK